MVVLYCVQLAKREPYFSSFLSLYGSQLELAENGICTRLGSWKWRSSHTIWRSSWLDARRDRHRGASGFLLALLSPCSSCWLSALLTYFNPRLTSRAFHWLLLRFSCAALLQLDVLHVPHSLAGAYLSIWNTASEGLGQDLDLPVPFADPCFPSFSPNWVRPDFYNTPVFHTTLSASASLTESLWKKIKQGRGRGSAGGEWAAILSNIIREILTKKETLEHRPEEIKKIIANFPKAHEDHSKDNQNNKRFGPETPTTKYLIMLHKYSKHRNTLWFSLEPPFEVVFS